MTKRVIRAVSVISACLCRSASSVRCSAAQVMSILARERHERNVDMARTSFGFPRKAMRSRSISRLAWERFADPVRMRQQLAQALACVCLFPKPSSRNVSAAYDFPMLTRSLIWSFYYLIATYSYRISILPKCSLQCIVLASALPLS